MIVKAHAKINLSLDVRGKRDDGYHDLETIMLPLQLHDSIDIKIIKNETKDDYVACDDFLLSISKYNLVHKIIDAARKKWGFTEHFVVKIHKNIFLQAGLGGGSADAGAALIGIIKLLKIDASREDLIELASSVGSDVPWALFNKPCHVKRKGEILEAFDWPSNYKNYSILLVKPQKGLSTQAVFEKGDEIGFNEHCDINKILETFKGGNMNDLQEILFNSLEKPALELLPEIQAYENMLKKDGLNVIRMTGAGSCIFGISEDEKLVKNLLKTYTKRGYIVEMTKFL